MAIPLRHLTGLLLAVSLVSALRIGEIAHAGQTVSPKTTEACVSGMRQKVGPHGKIPYYAPCFCQKEKYPSIEKRMAKLAVGVRSQSGECEPVQGYCRCMVQLIWKELPTDKQKAVRCREVAAAVSRIRTEDMPKMLWHQSQAILDESVLTRYCSP